MMNSQPGKKRKHNTATLAEKWEIIQRHARGETPATLSAVYGIPRPTVYDIIKNKEKVERFIKSVANEPGNRKTTKTAENPKVEDALYAWFHQQRERHAPISGEILKEKAKFFYEEIENKQDFHASDGWLKNFKSRFGIRLLQISGERLSADESEIPDFILKLDTKINEMGLTPDQVYNADETGLNWRQLPTSTYVTSEEASAPGRKMRKERLTLMPCTNASGSHKLKLMVVGKAKKPRPFKNLKVEDLPVVYKAQSRAWVSREVFKDWYSNNFVPSVKEFLKKNNCPQKALLLLDNAPGHPLEEEEEMKVKTKDGSIEIMFLPKNTTALIQPLDQNVIKTLKMHYKKRLLMDIVSSPEKDISTMIAKFNIKDAIINAAYAWEQVTPNNILRSWKNVWPANPLLKDLVTEQPENNDDFLDSISMVCEMQTKQFDCESLQMKHEDMVQWLMSAELDADLSDQEIVDEVTSQGESTDDNIEEAVPAAQAFTVSCDDAMSAATTLLRWAEERGVGMEHVIMLKTFQEKVMTDSFKRKSQKTLDDYFRQ